MLTANSKRIKYISLPFLGMALFIISHFLDIYLAKPKIRLSREDTSYTLNTTGLKLVSMGSRRLVSSLLWTSTLLFSDTEHVKDEKNSWMFYRFKTISELEPEFYPNYLFGGIYLSIIKDDLLGAKYIYEKGLDHFPNDFKLVYNSAFNYLYELGDIKSALPLYRKLISMPESQKLRWLPSLVAKLERNQYDSKAAFQVLYETYKNAKDEFFKQRLHNILYSLKAEIDLNCLNSHIDKVCSYVDFDGESYQVKDGFYRSNRPLEKLNLSLKKKRPSKN